MDEGWKRFRTPLQGLPTPHNHCGSLENFFQIFCSYVKYGKIDFSADESDYEPSNEGPEEDDSDEESTIGMDETSTVHYIPDVPIVSTTPIHDPDSGSPSIIDDSIVDFAPIRDD